LSPAIEALRVYLTVIPAGAIKDTDELASLLGSCWDDLSGDKPTDITAFKVSSRLEQAHWQPPLITFIVERHGAIVAGGSKRAECQGWVVDIEAASVRRDLINRSRLVVPQDKPLDVKPLVAEVVNAILNNQPHKAVVRKSDALFKVEVAEIIPSTVAATTSKRRKRFWEALDESMLKHGWQRQGRFVYGKQKP